MWKNDKRATQVYIQMMSKEIDEKKGKCKESINDRTINVREVLGLAGAKNAGGIGTNEHDGRPNMTIKEKKQQCRQSYTTERIDKSHRYTSK